MLFLRTVLCSFCIHLLAEGDQQIDSDQYKELEENCHRVIYNIHRNLSILEWPDSLTREILRIHIEDYLMGLNTSEARKLCAKYEEVGWDIAEMVEIHYRPREDQRIEKN